jgi:hypothetical protein
VARSKNEIARAQRYESEFIRRRMSARLDEAIKQGLVAAALIEGDGTEVAFAGAITADEVTPLAAFVIYRPEGDDVESRLLAGEIISLTLDARDVALGIPSVCVHSLRGLHATLATEAGVSSHVVANALGHSSPAVTQAHYTQPGAQKRASTKRVLAKLAEPLPTGSLHPVRAVAGTNRSRVVPAKEKRLSRLSQDSESLGAIERTRTSTVLPTGT